MLQTFQTRLECVSEPPQKINESEAELVASQSCSQSAAQRLVLSIPGLSQAKTAEGLTSRSRMTRTHLGVNAQIRSVTMQTGSGEMGASPGTQRSLRAGLCMLGVLRSPQSRLIRRKMSRECSGIFLSRGRRDNKDSSPKCAHEGFARARVKDCMRSRTPHCLKVIRMCTRARLAGAKKKFVFSASFA